MGVLALTLFYGSVCLADHPGENKTWMCEEKALVCKFGINGIGLPTVSCVERERPEEKKEGARP